MIGVLEYLVEVRGAPKFIRSDNGPEFIARAIRDWLATAGIGTLYIEPGSPWENAYSESFNGKLRDEGGYTILVIEHDMHVVEGISDRVVALDHGEKIAEGTFEQVATSPRVVEAYLGRRGEDAA